MQLNELDMKFIHVKKKKTCFKNPKRNVMWSEILKLY